MSGHYWLPAGKRRHALAGDWRRQVLGQDTAALCGVEVELYIPPPSSDDRWLWPSCMRCWAAAKTRADRLPALGT